MTCLNSANLGREKELEKVSKTRVTFSKEEVRYGGCGWKNLCCPTAKAAAVEEYDSTSNTWRVKNLLFVCLLWGEIGVKTLFVSVNDVNKNWQWVLPSGFLDLGRLWYFGFCFLRVVMWIKEEMKWDKKSSKRDWQSQEYFSLEFFAFWIFAVKDCNFKYCFELMICVMATLVLDTHLWRKNGQTLKRCVKAMVGKRIGV